jgi:hypothetical protein
VRGRERETASHGIFIPLSEAVGGGGVHHLARIDDVGCARQLLPAGGGRREEEVGWAGSWAAICCTEQQIRQRERRTSQKQPRRRREKKKNISIFCFLVLNILLLFVNIC